MSKRRTYPLLNEYGLHVVLNGSNIGLWEYDGNSHTLHYSLEAMKIFGHDTIDMDYSKIDWKKQIHPDDLEYVKEKFYSHFSNQTEYYKSEHRQLCKSGDYKWVLDYGKILERDESGEPLRVIGSFTDITTRKAQEMALSKNLEIIKNQNKILENFARMSSHNLKEYAGNFESLLDFYEEAENETEKSELIAHLKTVSKSLTQTVANLSDIISKQNLENLQREDLNLYKCIDDVNAIFETEMKKQGITLNNNVDKNIYIYSNKAYVRSVIQNIASNAIKYAHPERALVIDVNSFMAEDGFLKVTITDNGIGIDLDKYGKDIFQLYRTFHGNKDAEGIGLYITRNQVEALGGKIELTKSEVNVGTTFTVSMNTKKDTN